MLHTKLFMQPEASNCILNKRKVWSSAATLELMVLFKQAQVSPLRFEAKLNAWCVVAFDANKHGTSWRGFSLPLYVVGKRLGLNCKNWYLLVLEYSKFITSIWMSVFNYKYATSNFEMATHTTITSSHFYFKLLNITIFIILIPTCAWTTDWDFCPRLRNFTFCWSALLAPAE